MTRRLTLMSSVLALAACAVFEVNETTFLRSAQNKATQEEIKEHLGEPVATKSVQDGETIWIYQVRYQQPGNYLASPGMWCDEYVLAFDRQRILRRWTHKSHFHGSEFQPTYCVPGGVDDK